MGIECDGATYHSAKSTRDRDRLRQAILESLGWRILRIWSTDWFKHPQAQLQPILQELEELRSYETSSDLEPAIGAIVELAERKAFEESDEYLAELDDSALQAETGEEGD